MQHRVHFVVPPFGIEFASTEALLDGWRRAGIRVAESNEDVCSGEGPVFHRAAQAGGIATIPADPQIERRLLTIGGRLLPRAAAYGTEVGNADAMQLRGRVQMILPERVPAWALPPGVKPFKAPVVGATFEHSALAGHGAFVLLVPKSRGFSLERFGGCCQEIGLAASPAGREVDEVVPDLDLWFTNPQRKLLLLEVEGSAGESKFLLFARLYYACLRYDSTCRGLDSAHLIADFGNQCPNFRRYWTSNK